MPTRIIIDVTEDIQFGPEAEYILPAHKTANIYATDPMLLDRLGDRMHLEQQKLQRVLTTCQLNVSTLIIVGDKPMKITFARTTQEEFENGRTHLPASSPETESTDHSRSRVPDV